MSDIPPDDGPMSRPEGPSRGQPVRWTPIAVGVLAVLSLVGYLDLKTQLARIEAPSTVAAPPPTAGDPEAATPPPSATPAPVPGPDAPAVQAPDWGCEGTLTGEQVASAIGRHGPSVFACYETRLRQAPELSGTLHMHLRVDPAGAVDQVRFAGPLRDAELLGCIRDTLPEWRFPPPAGGSCAVVHAPFSLGP